MEPFASAQCCTSRVACSGHAKCLIDVFRWENVHWGNCSFVHGAGGFGVDFSLATDDFKSGIDLVSQKILSHGVTSFCPTLVTSPPSVYHQVSDFLPLSPAGRQRAEFGTSR